MIPNTDKPDIYRQIVSEDRQMTDKITRKEMTRNERRARLNVLVTSIKEHEEKARAHRRMQLRTIRNLQRAMMRLR